MSIPETSIHESIYSCTYVYSYESASIKCTSCGSTEMAFFTVSYIKFLD